MTERSVSVLRKVVLRKVVLGKYEEGDWERRAAIIEAAIRDAEIAMRERCAKVASKCFLCRDMSASIRAIPIDGE